MGPALMPAPLGPLSSVSLTTSAPAGEPLLIGPPLALSRAFTCAVCTYVHVCLHVVCACVYMCVCAHMCSAQPGPNQSPSAVGPSRHPTVQGPDGGWQRGRPMDQGGFWASSPSPGRRTGLKWVEKGRGGEANGRRGNLARGTGHTKRKGNVQFQALQWDGRAGEGSQPTRAEECQAFFSLLAAWEPQHCTSGHCKKTGEFCSECASQTILEPC